MFIQKISPVNNIKFRNNLSKNKKTAISEAQNIKNGDIKLLLELYGLRTKASADVAIGKRKEENKATNGEKTVETKSTDTSTEFDKELQQQIDVVPNKEDNFT